MFIDECACRVLFVYIYIYMFVCLLRSFIKACVVLRSISLVTHVLVVVGLVGYVLVQPFV